jgi:hypothetical protein
MDVLEQRLAFGAMARVVSTRLCVERPGHKYYKGFSNFKDIGDELYTRLKHCRKRP